MAIDPRNGAPKKLNPPSFHPGMTRRQQDGFLNGGLGHAYADAPIADGPTAADPTSAGKAFVGKCAPDHPGMKHVTGKSELDRHTLGARVWREALDQSEPATRLAHTGSPLASNGRPAADPAEREELKNAGQ